MPRKAEVLYSLTRGRVRASWNKHNLFNLYKKGRLNLQGQNLYQQKWHSKQETRAYHGEFITESRFQSEFQSKLESVANLDASLKGGEVDETPYTLQTYAVLEKRLDFALFRAMFASSVRQARQFILHGYVTVNGIRIREPGYKLTSGDIFHIEPEKALYALGAFKPSLKQALQVDQTQVRQWNAYVSKALKDPKKTWEEQQHSGNKKLNDEDKVEKIKQFNDNLEKNMLSKQKEFTRTKALETVIELGKEGKFNTVFNKEASEKASKLYTKISESFPQLLESGIPSEFLTQKTEDLPNKKQFSELKQLVSSVQNIHHEHLRKQAEESKVSPDAKSLPYDPNWTSSLRYHKTLPKTQEILEQNPSKTKTKPSKLVNLPWQKGFYGHENPSKPYFTPWKLRPFIAPFAILPHHLEISFKTCHAVYLRDPVSMSGKSEVISPFDADVHERAYMWYIRRSKTAN